MGFRSAMYSKFAYLIVLCQCYLLQTFRTIHSWTATRVTMADHTSIAVEDLLEELKESMRGKLGPDRSPLPSTCCIFKVPQVLRRHNPKAYQPDVVSIGPYHRHRKQLQRMETVKRWYFRNLLTGMKISPEAFIQLINDDTGNDITAFEKRARSSYAEPLVHIKEKEFMETMILDGCFIIQLFLNFKEHEEKKDDPILNMDCMFQYICHDLLLLENQLPWIVLSCLYRVIVGRDSQFSELLLKAFCSLNSMNNYFNSYFNASRPVDEDRVLHILDLARTSIVFTSSEHSSRNNQKCLWWFAGKKNKSIGPEIPGATALSEAGVKFKKNDLADNLLNIKFENGVLTIPKLAVAELTEPLFRNLIAFEQCYHDRPHQITSYAVFMDKLICSDKDIKLLSEKKILANWLSVEDGSKFFNKLYIDTLVKEFQYKNLCTDVNKFYQVGWHKQLEILRRDYFASPWTVISLIAGIILLVLTLLQTIFTIHQ